VCVVLYYCLVLLYINCYFFFHTFPSIYIYGNIFVYTSLYQGLEPVLHEDITTHICTSMGGALSGVVVLVTTCLLLHQRNNHFPEITDQNIVVTMFLSYVLSYTLILTAFEPLRAAVKASYISFAQNPQSFLQTYPLIYHRLSRLTATTTNES
jgi:hypothetical protein